MIFKMLDAGLAKSHTTAGLFLLNQAFRLGIPFNIPHGFRLTLLDQHSSEVVIPKIKTNTNHLGTIHACAMATAGEFSAGVLLLKTFGATQVRLVLKTLHVDYQRQGTKRLFARAEISDHQLKQVSNELADQQKTLVKLDTTLTDKNGQVACVVTTEWQVKKWSAVTSRF